ncbi:hypothetical protein Q6272_31660, partial [Klebsiella pneumoniae]
TKGNEDTVLIELQKSLPLDCKRGIFVTPIRMFVEQCQVSDTIYSLSFSSFPKKLQDLLVESIKSFIRSFDLG